MMGGMMSTELLEELGHELETEMKTKQAMKKKIIPEAPLSEPDALNLETALATVAEVLEWVRKQDKHNYGLRSQMAELQVYLQQIKDGRMKGFGKQEEEDDDE